MVGLPGPHVIGQRPRLARPEVARNVILREDIWRDLRLTAKPSSGPTVGVMDPAVSLARVPRRPLPSDLVAAGIVLVWAILEALLGKGPGATLIRVGFALVISLPLVFRRRAPLAVIAILSAATVGWALSADQPEAGTMPFPAILLALFSVALYARAMVAAVLGLALALAAMLITLHSPFYDTTPTAGNTAILFFFSGGTWTAGWLVRRRAALVRAAYDESGELARSAVTDERERIARELHDVVAHGISIVAVQAGAAEQLLDKDIDAARVHLAAVRRTARETMIEMRRLLGVLREDDATYVPQPGLARIPDLLDDVRSAGVVVEFSELGHRRELPAGIDLVAYRVIQEALTNVRKHAPGSPARVVVSYGAHDVSIEVTNQHSHAEPRFDEHQNGQGQGLVGMRERVRIFGGGFDAGEQPDGGFHVRATIPLDQDST
jgi:signal transduction histidine kinase